MSKLIVIDPGHGGEDPGAVGNGLREKDLTLTISKLIRDKLRAYDVQVLLTRTTDIFLTLTERTVVANKAKADAFLSVHINAGGGTGYEDYIYNGNVSSNTGKLHNAIHAGVIKQIGGTDRGKKRANFAVLRQTNMPAVLTENLFIDRKEDAAKLKDSKFLDKVAQGHADGIVDYFGLTKKKASTTPKPQQSGLVWVGTDQKGMRVESIYRGSEGLNFYDGPRWTNPTGTFGYGAGWKVDNLYLVNGSKMYRVQNSKGQLFWITASPKYVRINGKF